MLSSPYLPPGPEAPVQQATPLSTVSSYSAPPAIYREPRGQAGRLQGGEGGIGAGKLIFLELYKGGFVGIPLI